MPCADIAVSDAPELGDTASRLEPKLPDAEHVVEHVTERLVACGDLTESSLDRALRIHEQTGERTDQILIKLGLVSERSMAAAYASGLGMALVEPSEFPSAPLFPDCIGTKFLKEARLVPLADTAAGLELAMADPLDHYAIQAIQLSTGRSVTPRVAVPADIDAALQRLYGEDSASIEQLLEGEAAGGDEETLQDIERLREFASEAPVIRLVNHLIAKAVETGASDVHIEPFEAQLRVRYRIDGVLRETPSPAAHLTPAVVSRIKILAKLNIAETRLPQDGRIRLVVRGKEIDLRVSTVPTMHGESVVLRVLDRESVVLDFASLGVGGEALDRYLGVLERPHGILLVTGPTGSGKTTTLYTSLLHLSTEASKVLTVEDPIEYQLHGINQLQVQPQIGLTFASALRAFLRQDPDIIMIGEIRDLETAEIAAQAALTGHLVLSTLHTNDAASTVTRLLDMGLEDFLLASTLNGVSAQRLVRIPCSHCRKPYEVVSRVAEELRLHTITEQRPVVLYRAKGCSSCADTGYHGRTSIQEMLVMTDAIRELVLRRATAQEIEAEAVRGGMQTMQLDGLQKAIAGMTTIEEVMRVTREA